MNLWKPFIIFLILFSVSASETYAHSPFMFPPFYEGQSDFVIVPAMTGTVISSVPGLLVAGGGYIIGYAAGLPFGKKENFAENSFSYPLLGITVLGGAVAGAPFFILEKTFYDFPRYLLDSDEQTAR